MADSKHTTFSRRDFIGTSVRTAAAGMLVPPVFKNSGVDEVTVGQIIDRFLKEIPNAPFAETVDTLKAGSRDSIVSGVVTTMFATIPVIEKAKSLGANFIIAHEPTFYNHLDNTDWLKNDPTYQYKEKLLSDYNITVWRNHDYIHSHEPDGVYDVLLKKLGWTSYKVNDSPATLEIPAVSLEEVIAHTRESLGISMVRYMGDLNQRCRKVLLLPGAMGGENQIRIISENQPDLVLIGEAQEWTTPEYIRDTQASGKQMALIVMGHSDSEDPGSVYMKDWVSMHFPEISVNHIHSGNPFTFG